MENIWIRNKDFNLYTKFLNFLIFKYGNIFFKKVFNIFLKKHVFYTDIEKLYNLLKNENKINKEEKFGGIVKNTHFFIYDNKEWKNFYGIKKIKENFFVIIF